MAVIRRERWESVDPDRFFEEAPALVVEVHSPSNRQLLRKAALYLHHGSEQVWIVYPKSRRVRLLTQDEEGDYDVHPGDALRLAGLSIEVTQIFA